MLTIALPVPVIVSNFNYFYHRENDNSDDKDVKYSHPSETIPFMAAPASSGSIKRSDLDDSIGAISYQNMMMGAECDENDDDIDIYNSPMIPVSSLHTHDTVNTNLLDAWSSSVSCAPPDKGGGHSGSSAKYHLLTNNAINTMSSKGILSKSNSFNINANNVETDV